MAWTIRPIPGINTGYTSGSTSAEDGRTPPVYVEHDTMYSRGNLSQCWRGNSDYVHRHFGNENGRLFLQI